VEADDDAAQHLQDSSIRMGGIGKEMNRKMPWKRLNVADLAAEQAESWSGRIQCRQTRFRSGYFINS
jgi:hypothetical protein